MHNGNKSSATTSAVFDNIKHEIESTAATYDKVKKELKSTCETLNHIEKELNLVGKIIPVSARDKFFYHDDHYQKHWPHFDQVHQEMMKKEVGRDIPMSYPRCWMGPKFISEEDADKDFNRDHEMIEEQSVHVKDTTDSFEVSMDTHGYQWVDVKVQVNTENVLTIEGKHEVKEEGVYQARQFCRQFRLPEGCEGNTVVSSLSKDGILLVTALKEMEVDKEE